jgi:hypothetical protein
MIKGYRIHPVFLSPFSYALYFAVVLNKVIHTFISRLLLRSSPSAIRRLVISIVVYPVDAVLIRRARTHVLIKRLERRTPTLANLNSATTIMTIAGITNGTTSTLHPLPNSVLATLRKTMFFWSHTNIFFNETTARASIPSPKRVKTILFYNTTVANALHAT